MELILYFLKNGMECFNIDLPSEFVQYFNEAAHVRSLELMGQVGIDIYRCVHVLGTMCTVKDDNGIFNAFDTGFLYINFSQVFLLTLPFALGMRHIGITMKIILAYCMITFLFWSSTAQQMRYLIPVFPFLAILTGVILTYYRNKRFIFGMLVLLISLSVTFNLYHISRDMLRIRPVGVVIGRESTEAFMHRMLPSYSIFQYANKNLPGDSKIFLIYMKNLTYLCDHDCYSDSMFESYTMQKIISSSTSSDMIRQKLKAWGFTHILYDHTYVYGSPSTFSPEEKSLFLNFQRQYLSAVAVKEPYYLFRIE